MRILGRGLLLMIVPMILGAQQSDSAQSVVISTRSAIGAGVLSYVFPGAGSLYAGNMTHAVVHAGVGVGSFVTMVAALGSCTVPSCPSSGQVLGVGAAVTFVVNSVWSIVTAVKDADAYNRAHAAPSSQRMSLSPTVVVLPRFVGAPSRGVGLGLVVR